MYDIHSVRKDFPVLDEVIYLDNGATTQTPVPAVNAMNDYFFKYAANHGRGAHRLARQTTDNYEDARDKVAEFLNTTPESTVLTKNATESINMVALGIQWEAGDHVVTTLVEHHSNFLPWMRLKEKGVEVTIVGSDREGRVNPKDVDAAITDRTKLVSVNHVSNVFGSIRDVEKITQIAQKGGAMVLVDGSQSAGHMPVDIKKIGCDFFATPGHKGLLGPQGTGILCIKDPDALEPTYVGGGTVHAVTTEGYELEPSPSKFEAGTPNIPGVIGLGRAVEYVQEIGVEDIEKHEKELTTDAAKRLSEIEGVEVYGPKDRTVVPFNVEGMNPHDVAMILDETRKICVRSGYHCAMPSVDMLGVEGTVRASFALYNTEEEVDSLIEGVEQITMLA
ncbi:cysteine desulfurase / selenocysteine lyase [Methanococcoides vulcani]|uniref:cysteine desulfurase n=1 Tax=Methanococcoides vulcani TaxID=1353158 RepID=A0A1H9Z8H6_9EURY|nr:cysteine desulfurase [Methanococcoides vulcani]SES77860.1 cysteine desulfurase / selenocysteine lyase [Methanococcoides vulcani]